MIRFFQILFFVSISTAMCAQNWQLKLSSNVYLRTWKLTTKADQEENEIGGATVALFQNGKQITQTSTDGNGAFTIMIPPNGEFYLIVSYPGCNAKRMSINTQNVPDKISNDNFNPSFKITGGFIMVKPYPGIDYSELKQDLIRVEYMPNKRAFDDTEEGTQRGLAIVGRVYSSEDALFSRFCSTNKAGDVALAKPDCPLAKKLYNEAIAMIPGESYPVEQLAKVGQCLKDLEEAQKRTADAKKAEQEKIAAEKAAAEKAASDKALAEKEAKERAEKEKAEKEKLAVEKAALDKAAAEKAAADKALAEKEAKERAEKERIEKEKVAAEKAAQDKLAKEKELADKALADKAAKERAEKERIEKEKVAAEKAAQDKLAKEKELADKALAEKEAKERAEKEKAEKAKVAAEKAELTKAQKEKELADKALAEKEAKERAEKEKAEKAKAAAEKAELTKAQKEKELADKALAEKEAKERSEKEKAEKAKAAAEKAELTKAQKEKEAEDKALAEKEAKERSDREKAEKDSAKKKTQDEQLAEKNKGTANTEEPKPIKYETEQGKESGNSPKKNSKYSVPQVIGGGSKYKEYVTKADGFLNTKKYAEALPLYQEALRQKPNDPYATAKLEECKKMLNK